MTETLSGEACQQPQFAKSDVRHSRRMARILCYATLAMIIYRHLS